MAKVKNKRNSGLADKIQAKRKAEIHKKKLNPFEVHINKEKIKVLGKKSKHDRGLPGVSRAKAIQKRKETLGTEMKLMHKTNTFIDRRIGEKDSQLSAEDRIVARFAAERAKQHSKKNIFNLADDEILTHRGQTLEQIEKFDDPKSSDDEDDAEGRKGFGGLDDDFVSEGHFGGGVLSRTEARDGAKSHKDLIEQLIADSKKRKAEKQKEKEQTLDLTEKLDTEWKDLQPVVLKRARVEEKEESLIDKLLKGREKGQDYDKMMRELRFEKRGTPSDGLKSEEQQQKEERQKIEQYEREREQRMLDEESSARVAQPTTKHRSADDLDDNFELDNEPDFMLAYDNDGNPLLPDHILKANSVPNSKKQFQDGVSDSSSDEEESDGEDNGNDDAERDSQDNNASMEKKNKATKQNGNKSSSDSDDVSEEDEKEIKTTIAKDAKHNSTQEINDDDVSDNESVETLIIPMIDERPAKTVETKSKQKDEIKPTQNETILFAKPSTEENSDDSSDDEENDDEEEEGSDDEKSENQNKFDNLADLEASDDESIVENEPVEESYEDKEKIASFFDMKSAEGDKLQELLSGKTPVQQSAAIQKLIKSYDPSLSENNKDLLTRLYAHLLQYINDLFAGLKQESDVVKAFVTFDKIVPHLYDLSHTNKVSTKKCLVEVLREKHDDFKKNPKKVPDLDTLIFFKVVSLIYPTSDFSHPVTTPSIVFMSEILTKSRFRDVYSVSRGLFITALLLEYTVLSKRFIAAPINYLRGVLFLSANTSILNPIQVVPPFRLHKDDKFLVLEDDCTEMAVENKMAAKDLVLKEPSDDFKIRCLSTCSDMIKEFFDNYNDIEAQACIFEPHIQLLARIDLDLYPKKVVSRVSEVLRYMKQSLEVKTYTRMTKESKKPKMLRLYEPDVQEVFTGKTSKLTREQVESSKLQHKYKKEMKGALREIRRDKSYIASVKIKQKIQSDNVRKDKVKQIYKDASIQQGELNKLKRMK